MQGSWGEIRAVLLDKRDAHRYKRCSGGFADGSDGGVTEQELSEVTQELLDFWAEASAHLGGGGVRAGTEGCLHRACFFRSESAHSRSGGNGAAQPQPSLLLRGQQP